jgi:SAM-dependent methyltransferase
MINHSTIYLSRSPLQWHHRRRLRFILQLVDTLALEQPMSYADVGCSNGYVTHQIANRLSLPEADAFDHSKELLVEARKHPGQIRFLLGDLNRKVAWPRRYDFVSCLETLEHVGDLQCAIKNLADALAPGGLLLISVPIEVGFWGTAKFLTKRMVGYTLDELPGPPSTWLYLRRLLSGASMSGLRDARKAWGTHFGFDYRDVEVEIRRCGLEIVQAQARTANRIILARRGEARS